MSPVIKFWIASTITLFILSYWPFRESMVPGDTSSDLVLTTEAKLIDYFCLGQSSGSGRASNPKAWEEALDIKIKIRESAGEAAGDIKLPREQSDKLTGLTKGQGVFHSVNSEDHFVYRSAQGRDWYLVITKSNSSLRQDSGNTGERKPSPLALSIGFALIGGAIMSLLARVAFRPHPSS